MSLLVRTYNLRKVRLISTTNDLVGQLNVKGSTAAVFVIARGVTAAATTSKLFSHFEMAFDCCSNAASKGRTSRSEKSML